MTKAPTAHDRAQKRYRARQKNDIVASAMGWEQTDIVSVFVRQDGVHVALDSGSKRVALVGEQFVTVDAPERTEIPTGPVKPSKVYAPKSWPGDKWNEFVKVVQSKQMTVEAVLKSVDDAVWDDKQKTHVRGIIKAMPDTPDWYTSLPLADL